MNTFQQFRRLGRLDAALIGRDSLFLGMLAIPLVVAVAIRLLLPILSQQIGQALGLDLSPFAPLVASTALLLITPCMYGILTGLLLLDQRDERTLLALSVTPVSFGHYLLYRVSVPALLCVPMTGMVMVLGSAPYSNSLTLVLAVLSAAPITALLALTLCLLADNKVQGIALIKALSALMILPLGGVLAPWPWAACFGLLPTMWPVWVLRTSPAAVLGWFSIGLLYHAVLAWLCYRSNSIKQLR